MPNGIPTTSAPALQQLQPIQTNFGDIVREEEQLQFKYRAEERAKQAERRKRDEKLAKDLATDASTLDDVITRVKSIDEGFALGVNEARDKIYDIYRQMANDPRAASNVDLQIQLANLRKFATRLKGASDSYTQYAKDFTKGMQDGTYSDWNRGRLDQINAIFKDADFTIKVDDKGNPVAVVRTPEGLQRVNLIDVLDGRGLTGLVNTFDLAGDIEELDKTLGDRNRKEQRGFLTVETQTFAEHEKFVRNLISNKLGTAEEPSDIAKSIWTDAMGNRPKKLTDKDIKAIEDFYVDYARSSYDEKYAEDFDTAQARLALDRKKAREKDKDVVTLKPDIDTETGEIIEYPVEGPYTFNTVRGFNLGRNLEAPSKTVTLEPGVKVVAERSIQKLYISPDGKTILADVEEKLPATQKKKKFGRDIEKIPAKTRINAMQAITDKQLQDLADRGELVDDDGNKFTDAKAFKDFLKQKVGIGAGRTAPRAGAPATPATPAADVQPTESNPAGLRLN